MNCELCGLKVEKKGSRQFNVEGPSYHKECYLAIVQKKRETITRKKRGLQLYLS